MEAEAEARLDRRGGDAGALCPIGSDHRLAERDDHKALAGVASLLFRRRPSAVLGAVPAVVVDAVDGVRGRRLRSHVRKEALERLAPPLAHGDPAPAIGGERLAAGVAAAILHRLPRLVFFRRATHAASVGRSVFPGARRCRLAPETPA